MDFKTGNWNHLDEQEFQTPLNMDFETLLNMKKFELEENENIKDIFESNLIQAQKIIKEFKEPDDFKVFESRLEELMLFYVINYKNKI